MEPSPDPQPSARLVRVETVLERTLTSTPIPLSPEVKSFLVPGWGQFAQKRTALGVLFSALAAAGLTTAIVYAVRGSEAYENYQNAGTAEEAARYREETMDADRTRNIAIVSTVGVWGINVLDAALAERRRKKKSAPSEN